MNDIFVAGGLLQVLYLLAHLFDQQLHRHRGVGQFLNCRFRPHRIGFAVEFLHHEVQPLANLPTFFQDVPGFGQMRAQAGQFLGNVDADAVQRDFLADAFQGFVARRSRRGSCTLLHSQADDDVYAPLQAIAGSISAEHGIGTEKLSRLPISRSAIEIELMRTLKRSLDPLNILNRGKVIELQ